MADRRRTHLVISLSGTIDRSASVEGLNLEVLRAGDLVEVATRHHRYTFRMIDPKTGLAEARGNGEHLAEPRQIYVQGSSLSGTGSQVRPRWIGVGYRLLVGRDLLLSEVREISVNGRRFAPAAPDAAIN